MERESKIYEIGYLLTPLIAEEKLPEEISVLRNLIENKHGLIIKEEAAKPRRLAYEIKKPNVGSFKNGYFGWIKFMIEPETVDELKKSIDKNSNIIRFVVLDITRDETVRKLPAEKIIKRKRPVVREAKPKEEIKTEEIDKKLEEILGE